MVNLEDLIVEYKYTRTMNIVKNTMLHVIERWESDHIFKFMDGKEIEFHLSPEYEYKNKKYTQITLDLDLSSVHKREGTSKDNLINSLKLIQSRLKVPYVIEFTGNGYRIATLYAWADLDLAYARNRAKKYPVVGVDITSSFRDMPIARIGTYNPGRRLIVPCEKSDAYDFSYYKSLSKKAPFSLMGKNKWLKTFKKHWILTKFLSSGGKEVINKLFIERKEDNI